ncbi:hypothetical protein [Burkholderia sp. LMG 32019]|uniref:hypothetical protein n=1 Tax=Burkholderia sp. LMG 32019 TaxID=3158173 RepID=UPI003C30AD8B
MKGGVNESEKMMLDIWVRSRVFICFNYYADAKVFFFTAISTLERPVILSVFSRMNQIRFGRQRKRVPTACRRLLYRAVRARRRANRFSFVMAPEGAACAAPHGSQAEMPAPPALRFSSLKHPFIWPSGAGPRAGFVRLIRLLLRGAQRSPGVSNRYCDTFLKQKMSFLAPRAVVAAVCRVQSAVE